MRRIPVLALAACALIAGSCGRRAEEPPAAPAPPATAPAQVPATPPPPAAEPGISLDARGTEPFWAVKVRPAEILLLRPDHPPLRMSNPGPRITGPQAIWAGRAHGEPLIVAIWLKDCSDGMSDTRYPFSAEVQVGAETLKGCAEKVEPKAPGADSE